MKNTIIFEGKVTIAEQLVDFRIYKNEGEEIKTYYSFEINPEVKDVSQATYHTGAIQRNEKLEDLLFQFRNVFQKEFTQVIDMRLNKNY